MQSKTHIELSQQLLRYSSMWKKQKGKPGRKMLKDICKGVKFTSECDVGGRTGFEDPLSLNCVKWKDLAIMDVKNKDGKMFQECYDQNQLKQHLKTDKAINR